MAHVDPFKDVRGGFSKKWQRAAGFLERLLGTADRDRFFVGQTVNLSFKNPTQGLMISLGIDGLLDAVVRNGTDR